MPTKLLDGSPVSLRVSNDTAIPEIPANPSPPPIAPSAVAFATLASASVNVRPSAPLPWPRKASNVALMPAPVTDVGQKAEPAADVVAAVSRRAGGLVFVTRRAAPFSCQPPATGAGIAVAAAAGPAAGGA